MGDKLAGIETAAKDDQTITAGAGLLNGGVGDVTLDIGAHGDGSITVNADNIQVGVLATDASHGARGGGTQHANAVPSGAAGFMSGADKEKLDGVEAAATIFNDGWNGSIIESTSVTVTSNGTVVTLAVEASGGGDLTCRFGSASYVFDCTPAATTPITAGTDSVPVETFVWLQESGGTVTFGTGTTWPATPFCAIATVLCQSAASLQTDGALKVYAWTDHVADSSENGHISHLSRKIRQQPATWSTGVAPASLTGTNPNAYIGVGAGTVYQLHDHTFPALQMPTNPAWVVNSSVSPYQRITDLDTVDADASGNSIDDTWISVVLWGSVNEVNGDCKLFINLPTDSYASAANARLDASRFSVYTIPQQFVGTGFLIGRYILHAFTSGQWVQDGAVEDLRGLIPALSPGGSAGITVHNDLSSIQGGVATEYYHITNTQHANYRIVGVGATAGKTSYETAGYYYHDTDTGTYQRYSGSAWEDVGVTVDGTTLELTTDLHIADDGVTYAKMQNVVADGVFLGNNSGAGAIVDELTGTEATALLDDFATDATTSGLAPGSNSVGPTYYLNGNGAWTVPAGGTGEDATPFFRGQFEPTTTINNGDIYFNVSNFSGVTEIRFDNDVEGVSFEIPAQSVNVGDHLLVRRTGPRATGNGWYRVSAVSSSSGVNVFTVTSESVSPSALSNGEELELWIVRSGRKPQTKSITIEDPTASENISIFYTNVAITVTQLTAVILGTTSVSYDIQHGTSRATATGTGVVGTDVVANSSTTGVITTTFTDATIPADSFVWITTSALSGTPTELNVTIEYTED
jgi:hypothetical protein